MIDREHSRSRALRRYSLQVWFVFAAVFAAVGCSGSDAAQSSPVMLAQTAPAPKSAPAAPVPPAKPPPDPAAEPPALPAPVRVTNPRVAEALRYDPADPLANLESADAL